MSKRTLSLVSVALLCTIYRGSNRFAEQRFATIDVPAASETNPTGINAAGDVVGHYYSTTTSGVHGFLWSRGALTTIDFPNAFQTLPTGINAAGDIVGLYSRNNTSGVHGFLLSHGAFTTIDFPAAFRTLPTGIHAAGDIVGFIPAATIQASTVFF